MIAFWAVVAAAVIYLFILIVKALKKYIASREVREEKEQIKKSLSELLKENRIRCKMTQEFVAEAIGVSRQAVSKWENGTSDPSTSNLIALSQLYGISAEELIQSVTRECTQNAASNTDIKPEETKR
ncbi:MAG: helix-turn-helix transcriptional regulator [Lachnospiraceae bacterium]|nr:helix-turn-helix transcriptional regulator [Lachnospiraceae bacterium]